MPKGSNGLSDVDRRTLREEVYCEGLSSAEEYSRELRAAGFEVSVGEPMAGGSGFLCRTDLWTSATAKRLARWRRDENETVAACGRACYEELTPFYEAMADLFARGSVGGLIIVARKPLQ
jgi:hypothetical protein